MPSSTNVRFGSKADMCSANRHVRFTPESDIVCDKIRIMKPVTIASVRAHGVRQLLVYCNGKLKAIGPVTIMASCRSSNSAQRKRCQRYSADAAAQSAAGDGLI